MPTDEQRMREKELRRQVREPWLTFSEKHKEHLNTSELFFLREGYEAAWIQRDAEVQALRDENRQFFDLLLVVALANDGHGWLNPDVSERIDSAIGWDEKENPDVD